MFVCLSVCVGEKAIYIYIYIYMCVRGVLCVCMRVCV